MTDRALVVGLGAAARHVVGALQRHRWEVVVTEDAPGEATRTAARELGVELHEAPTTHELSLLLRHVNLAAPSPAVPLSHPVYELAPREGVPVVSEFELAAWWSERPMVAVTGTDGKTTVTAMVAAMLTASGVTALECGNNDLPLVTAIEWPADVLVVEASSFRLRFTERFRAHVGAWLNFADDHLDWHPTVEDYAESKARLWTLQRPDDVAVANAADPVVASYARQARSRVRWFGGDGEGDRVEDGVLVTASGDELLPVDELPRALPHDVANALAAAASALEAGATVDGVRRALREFQGLPHRVSLVGESGGVSFYDDSKATAPHAVLAALRAFDSVVLIAGGRNKGLDLSVLAAEAGRVRAVIAIGEAAPEVQRAFSGSRPVTVASSMNEAVAAAAAAARPGDAVVLSPGCASFDWYANYGERGDDFTRAVRALASATR